MKKIILSLLVTLSVINMAIAQGDIAAGKAKSAMCAGCHGADGNSVVPMYPKLAGQSANYIAKQLADFKKGATSGGKDGRNDPIMAGMVMTLTAQDMENLGAFYAAQTRTPSNAQSDENGKKLYFGGDSERNITACVACHGKTGHGMASAGFPSLYGQNLTYIKGQLTKFRAKQRTNDNNAMMRNIAEQLTDNEINQLAQFIATLK